MEKGVEYAKQMSDEYREKRYHQPSDEYNPETTDLSGSQFDAQFLFNVVV